MGGVTKGDVTSPPGDGPASHPARRPRSQAVENALRAGVLGSAYAYGRKPRSPQHRTAVTRRAGAPPAGPPTPSHPAASLRTTRALESLQNIGALLDGMRGSRFSGLTTLDLASSYRQLRMRAAE